MKKIMKTEIIFLIRKNFSLSYDFLSGVEYIAPCF